MKPERALLVLSVVANVFLLVFVSVLVIDKGKDLSTMQ